MTRTKNPLIKAIDIAAVSKAVLQHVQGRDPFKAMEAHEEFCGTSLMKGQMCISPMLLSLSMELALKAWIVLDGTGKGEPRGHDLLKLFYRTTSASQERLKARYKREIAPRHPSHFFSDDGLERVLENARNAFVQWRYIYELERARFDEGPFVEAIEMVLSEFESRIVVVKHSPLISTSR